MSTILVPLDFSDCAPRLLDEAIRFARAFRARLLLLHVSDVPPGLPLTAMLKPRGAQQALPAGSLLREDADAHLAPMVQHARERGVEAASLVAFGRISETILDVAEREQVEMIVMGTHGRTGFARATLGSIAEEVLRHADVPVITVRTRHHAGCDVSSCATCPLGPSDVERVVHAEEEG